MIFGNLVQSLVHPWHPSAVISCESVICSRGHNAYWGRHPVRGAPMTVSDSMILTGLEGNLDVH